MIFTEDKLYQDIVDTYRETGSVQKTAEKVGVSVVKVRRVLITEGLWVSDTSVRIGELIEKGFSAREIADELSITEKAVQQYMPYTKGIYMGDSRSVAAMNSEDYRKRVETVKQNIVGRNAGYQNSTSYGNIPDEKIKARKIKARGEDFYRLHLEILSDLPDESVDALRAYGGVMYGDTVSRDIIVPGSLPLYSLHYVIQRLFGWQNSHLHRFRIPDNRVKMLCDDSLKKYVDLVGIVFRSPWMDEDEEFWADDYEDGSFKRWLRKKYTGRCISLCHGESYFQCRDDVAVYLEDMLRREGEYNGRDMIGSFETMSLDDWLMVFMESGPDLLERLSVKEVLAFGDERLPKKYDDFMDEMMLDQLEAVKDGKDEPLNQPYINCITDELLYNYDFGDNWWVSIKGNRGCEDLIEAGRITREELDDAIAQMMETFRPVVIAQDGLSVFDDVGGLYGYCEFLKGTYGDGEYDGPFEYGNKEENLAWAKMLGWNRRRSGNKNFL